MKNTFKCQIDSVDQIIIDHSGSGGTFVDTTGCESRLGVSLTAKQTRRLIKVLQHILGENLNG